MLYHGGKQNNDFIVINQFSVYFSTEMAVLMWENVLHRLSETFIYTEQADSVSYLVYNKIQDKSCQGQNNTT